MRLILTTNIRLAASVGLMAVLAGACANQPAPPPPPAASSESSAAAQRVDQSSESTDENDFEESDAKPSVKFDFGGANIGDSESQDEVKTCMGKGYFYDRFDDEGGKCTKLKLALVSCNSKKSGLPSLLSAKQQTQFSDALDGSYEGWDIDQCVDCDPDSNSPICETKSGEKQVGTKVFFVLEDSESGEIRGKSLLIPVRAGKESEETDK